MFQVKITGWIFHGVWVVRDELLREIVYKSAIFIYYDIQKTFYCWINICSKISKRAFVPLAVFMFKNNPKKPPFLWATDEETPLSFSRGPNATVLYILYFNAYFIKFGLKFQFEILFNLNKNNVTHIWMNGSILVTQIWVTCDERVKSFKYFILILHILRVIDQLKNILQYVSKM